MKENEVLVYEVKERADGSLFMLASEQPLWKIGQLPEWFDLTPSQAIARYQAKQMEIIKTARARMIAAERLPMPT